MQKQRNSLKMKLQKLAIDHWWLSGYASGKASHYKGDWKEAEKMTLRSERTDDRLKYLMGVLDSVGVDVDRVLASAEYNRGWNEGKEDIERLMSGIKAA